MNSIQSESGRWSHQIALKNMAMGFLFGEIGLEFPIVVYDLEDGPVFQKN